MGIPQGVTLISGGGFNGKSTLLQAIELGVYNHIPGDGRELVVTTLNATKVKAEEGRFVSNTDIRPFINNLPFGIDTSRFSTKDASGSTSMAASIQEALEAGADALLYDEDTCATNFLVRDGRMQRLISQNHEPITPLVSRIREMWNVHKVSSVLVIGGCGDYLDVADTVIDMYEYAASDATTRAKMIAEQMPVSLETPATKYDHIPDRVIDIPPSLVSYKPPKAKTQWSIALFPSAKLISQDNAADIRAGLGSEERDDGDDSFVAAEPQSTDHAKMKTWLSVLERMNLDNICTAHRKSGNLARPRTIEIAMAINRLRYARMR
ncbi:hypothetical protein GGI23_000638 [Coemansia sp. RSA 2559]|nr:hypothetical protein GGI23_000638 [Coemansia sp. RSA 2559]KAJ2868903.1 hypothetical protein GGI22_000578 [Coemansia erecta]